MLETLTITIAYIIPLLTEVVVNAPSNHNELDIDEDTRSKVHISDESNENEHTDPFSPEIPYLPILSKLGDNILFLIIILFLLKSQEQRSPGLSKLF